MPKPKVSVLMPVYNGEKYLSEAINSILAQTFSDFEFIIINDGSTDNSVKIIEEYKDSRIKLVHNEKNIGLAETCNRGIALAKGEYIARMDCDDISLPTRLEKQVKFMDSNHEIGICGTWARAIGKNEGYVFKKLTDSEENRTSLLFSTCFVHPSVIMRKKMIENANLKYKKQYEPADDYIFWVEASEKIKLKNIPQILLLYRMHTKNISKLKSAQKINGARAAQLFLLNKLGLPPTKEEIIIHNSLRPKEQNTETFIDQAENLLNKIIKANKRNCYYNEGVLNKIVTERWLNICDANASIGFIAWKKFWQSPLSKNIEWAGRKEIIKFFIKCLLKK